MLRGRTKSILLGCTSIGALLVTAAAANAGALSVREQSTYGQGSSFAGVAAGGSLSSMFWNPATMTQVPGIQMEASGSLIIPYTANSTSSSTFGVTGGTGNIGKTTLVPSTYASWQINRDMWVGFSVNAPFGLAETLPGRWAGGGYGANSNNLKTYNFTPSFAYRINDWISVGAGFQAQYATADLGFAYNVLGAAPASISGGGWGYGFTGGVTLTPTDKLTVGLGYRSAINQHLNGTLSVPAAIVPVSTPGSVNTNINLPAMVSLGIRYKFAPRWTALATVEWSNWSSIGTVIVQQPNGAAALINSQTAALPFQFKDGWFYSIGAEYQWNEQLALRGGVGFEKSPVTDQVRMPLIADNDRLWLSGGLTYKFTKAMSLDFAYTHIFVKNTAIDISAASGNPWYKPALGTYTGTVDGRGDIVSLALKYRFDDPAPSVTKQAYHK